MQAGGAVESFDGSHRSAFGVGRSWSEALDACLLALEAPPPKASLGILYVTDHLAGYLTMIVEQLQYATGVQQWCGTVGLGVVAPGLELFDQAALSLLLLSLPEDDFQLLPPLGGELTLPPELQLWLEAKGGAQGLLHADPRTPDLAEMVASLAELHGVESAGGLSASRAEQAQICGQVALGKTSVLGVSGVLFSPSLGMVQGLSQGCSPLGPQRQVTSAEGRLIASVDGRPALTVLAEDLGAGLTEDPRQELADVQVALPIPGGADFDFLVRNIQGVDPVRGLIALSQEVEPGQRLQFVRRDAMAAAGDLDRTVGELLRQLEGPPRAAVYISCLARGPHLFGPGSQELGRLASLLGEIPLTGFFARGEICNRRLYGYTGVLTLFP